MRAKPTHLGTRRQLTLGAETRNCTWEKEGGNRADHDAQRHRARDHNKRRAREACCEPKEEWSAVRAAIGALFVVLRDAQRAADLVEHQPLLRLLLASDRLQRRLHHLHTPRRC